jgi:hypothetical protein
MAIADECPKIGDADTDDKRAIAESASATGETPSSISKPKSTTKTRVKTRKRMVKR